MNTDDILSCLGDNKVNVNIKTNKMNEHEVFKIDGDFMNAFTNFDNIFGNFKNNKNPVCNIKINTPTGTITKTCNGDLNDALSSIPGILSNKSLANTINKAVFQALEVSKKYQEGTQNSQGQQSRTPVCSKNMQETIERDRNERDERLKQRVPNEADNILFTIASYVDKTLPLFSQIDINKKLINFRDTLLDNLKNHNDAYKQFNFRSKKISYNDVVASLRSDREDSYPLIYYASNLFKSNIILEEISKKKVVIIEFKGSETNSDQSSQNDSYIYMKDDGKEAEERIEGFKSYNEKHIDEVIEQKRNTIGIKNLKKMLVKELKTLATELNIDLYKVVNTLDTVTGKNTSKKTALLKDELVEKISSLINRSI